MRLRTLTTRWAQVLGLASVAVLALASVAEASKERKPVKPGDRVEKRVRSEAPDARKVTESYVRVREPLPAQAGDHPASCDWVGYLRFRNRGGPKRSSRADAVIVGMPGILAGASMHDQVARNVVRRAAKRDRNVEYWALDRRSNCLEDQHGVEAAARERDPAIGFEYYYEGREVDGRRFGGFKSREEAAWLSEVGLEQTLRDWYAVIREGVPSRKRRRQILLCGGHSLGGPLTGSFAGWDFDGDPQTGRDAGFKQCAGFFGFDTSLEVEDGEEGTGITPALLAASEASPYLEVPPFTPETSQILGFFGVGAYYHPDRENELVARLPRTPAFELSARLLFARNAAEFAAGEPRPEDFRVTNETTLAAIWDDNSVPVTIMRTSLGTYGGGPIVPKEFPTPAGAAAFGAFAPLVNNSFLTAPETQHGPLYSWRSYRGVKEGEPPVDGSGRLYSSAQSEVTDVRDFSRVQFEAPADFHEQYFPTRIATEVEAAASGDRSGDLEHLMYDGISKRPALLIQAADSDTNSGAEQGKNTWERDGIGGELHVPGYNHIDVTMAAWRQNDGKPEASSKSLTKFALRATRPWRRGR